MVIASRRWCSGSNREATDVRNLRAVGDLAAGGYVIHPGKIVLPLGDGVLAWPFAAL